MSESKYARPSDAESAKLSARLEHPLNPNAESTIRPPADPQPKPARPIVEATLGSLGHRKK